MLPRCATVAGMRIEIGKWYELIHYASDPDKPDGLGPERYATLIKPLSEVHVADLQEAADKGGVRSAEPLAASGDAQTGKVVWPNA